MFEKLKQFKDLRDQAKKMQTALGGQTVEGSGDWGKFRITLDGNFKVLKVSIDPTLVGDRAKLESACQEAVNDGVKKIQKVIAEQMKDMGTLPDLFQRK